MSESTMITVIIPTYNAAKYIECTIKSVIDQTYRGWSLIIIDDHSTDGTWEIISGFCNSDERIKAIRLENNFGRPAGPRNVGISQAKTPWIAFLDADDIWHPQKLAIQLKVAEKYQYDLICTRMSDFNSEPPTPTFIKNKEIKNNRISFLNLITKNRIPTSSVLVRRDVLISLNGFEESVDYKAIEDYDLWLRMAARNYNIGKCSSILVYYRILANSISRNKRKHVKNVAWLIYQTLITQRPYFLPVYPYFLLSYIALSIYYRLIKKTL